MDENEKLNDDPKQTNLSTIIGIVIGSLILVAVVSIVIYLLVSYSQQSNLLSNKQIKSIRTDLLNRRIIDE